MKKVFKVEVDCAYCAEKAEKNIKKVDGVQSASLSFMTQRLTVEYDDKKADGIVKAIEKAGKKADGDFRILA